MTGNEQTTKHEYPSSYGRGKHWALDAAWDILDVLKPGALTMDVRNLLAGAIAGRLMKERESRHIKEQDNAA